MNYPNKLPEKFEWKGVYGNNYWMHLQEDGYYQWSLMGQEPDGSSSDFSNNEILERFRKGAWVFVKDLTEPKYPDHFQFNHEETSQVYDMRLLCNKWLCTHDGKGWGAWYTEEEIAEHIGSKTWTNITPVEEVVEETKKEPELVFPFTFMCGTAENILYTATSVDGGVLIEWESSDGAKQESSSFDANSLSRQIKDGNWIVKSVGEQPAPKSTEEDVYEAIDEDKYMTAAVINELADAVNNLVDALERLDCVKGRVGYV